MKKVILSLVIMSALVACTSQETKTSNCDSTCVDSLKVDSAVVAPKDSTKATPTLLESKK